MRIDVITLFPEVVQPYVTASIIGRAQQAGKVEIHTHQLRDYSLDSHKKVDDRPFGGGAGMVLMCQPVVDAVTAIEQTGGEARRILFTPQGAPLTQSLVRELAELPRLLLICAHYEGYDERIVELLEPQEISLGDFVLTGGEVPALALIDSVVRLLPGVLGNEGATVEESFSLGGGLEYPQYTRPREFRGLSVPDVLLSGNHAQIAAWRAEQSAARTRQRRPDLASHRSAWPDDRPALSNEIFPSAGVAARPLAHASLVMER